MSERFLESAPAPLREAMRDIFVTDICINGPAELFLDRGQGMEVMALEWSQAQLLEWVHQLLALAQKTWDAKNPFVDGILPTGHRFHLLMPPVSLTGILISIRRLPSKTDSFDYFAGPQFDFLCQQVHSGHSIILSGATGSGKTTLLRALLREVPKTERIIALEDTPELAPQHPHFISLNSRPPNADGMGEITLRTLLKQTLRMRPDRIILGECRGAEILELLQAMNTGHHGCMATLHANSTREALRRIELMTQLSQPTGLSSSVIREWIAGGIRYIVQLNRVGRLRVIEEISEVTGREGDTILLRPVVQHRKWHDSVSSISSSQLFTA